MPTYEYECTRCGAVVEIFQSIKEPARKKLKKEDPKACTCDAPVQRRIGTGGGLIFKGSGFYKTDYRSESYKQSAKGETDSKGKDAKSDGKPAPGGEGGTSGGAKEASSTSTATPTS